MQAGEIGVFVGVNTEEFNHAGIEAYQIALAGLSGKKLWPERIRTNSAVFRVGAWGYTGGLPKGFFADSYVAIHSRKVEETPDFQVGFYNSWIQERIIANDPVFLDGLKEIAQIETEGGGGWVLFRRERAVSESAFASVVSNALKRDPDNIWNEPWRIAIQRINDPSFDVDSSEERERRNGLLARNIYDLSQSSWGRWTDKIVRGSGNELRSARYPEILSGPEF
jgi:hypothetical protein